MNWRDIYNLNDNEVADQIRRDKIDILVDLAGHSGNHRLLVMARKPAPIQVTYLGYPDTTGLKEIDYRLTDEWADPSSYADQYYTEKLFRLKSGFLCYMPANEAPEIASLPYSSLGSITFGSLNNLSKITTQVVETWSRILDQVPNSRLVLKNLSLSDEGVRKIILDRFTACGVNEDRLVLAPPIKDYAEHLAIYAEIDIALDTFPYNGTTTTCEALWMGAPVISLLGRSHASRVGNSILSRLGLKELVAENREQYVAIARNLAGNIERLNMFRNGIRNGMMRSTLCYAPAFTQGLEAAYQDMWREWCIKRPKA